MNLSSWKMPDREEVAIPTVNEEEYRSMVAQMTADHLTEACHELLQNEGISIQDIQLTLKSSDKGRISVVRAVIYINQDSLAQTAQIKSIIYRNIEKEPEIYVLGEASHEMAE
jgi:DNA-binding XRE family transcriptional regulator